MRILVVNAYAHVTGGADTLCLLLTERLRERGHEIAWLATSSPHNVERTGAFIPASVTNATRGHLPPRRRAEVLARAFWNPAAAKAMRRLLTDFRPDVVSSHKLYPQLSVAPIVLAARHRVPVVQTLWDYELISASAFDHTGSRIDRDEERASYRLLNTATLPVRRLIHARRLSACVSVSNLVCSVHERHGVASTVVKPPVEKAGETAAASFEERSGIAFAGRLVEAKGVQEVVELARRLPAVRVTIAGSGRLESLVCAEAKRIPNLTYVGWVGRDKVKALFRSARLVVLPSRWEEPSGTVSQEALAVGTPVVTYRRGGLAEIILETGAGCVVEERLGALLETCAEIHDNRTLWEELSSRALSALDVMLSEEEWADRMCTVHAAVVRP